MAKKGLFGWFSSDDEEEIENEFEEEDSACDDELTAFLTKDGDFSDEENQNDRFCPCGKVLDPEWRFCPKCGRDIGKAPERYCANCEEPAEENWDYCPKCGHLIDEEI